MTNARFTLLSILLLATGAFLAQFAIEFSSENLAANCIVFASSLSIIGYMAWSKGLQNNPLSTFAIFGFCLTTQLGALIAQSIYWTPLIKDLREPLITFSVLAIAQLIALCTHITYRLFGAKQNTNSSIARSILKTLNIYEIPSVEILWVLGSIGFVGFVFGYGGGANTFGKINQGIMFLAWAPFLIPMYIIQQGPSYCNKKLNFLFLAFYISLIILLGLAVNARGVMLSGFITIGLFALLTTMRSQAKVSQSLLIKLLVGAVVLGALSIPLSDLATAMVIARKARGTVSPMKMIEDTIYYVQQPSVLKARREKDSTESRSQAYDETYLANPLLARLIETKFHDNALYFSLSFNEKQSDDLAKISFDFILAILPTPILEALDLKIDKETLQFSMGDYIANLGIGTPLGGYKTGSMLAQGLALFGSLFLFIYILLCYAMFKVMDFLVFRNSKGDVVVSALGMLSIWKFFQYGITAESLHHTVSSIFRNFPQNAIIYGVMYFIARRLIQIFFTKRVFA